MYRLPPLSALRAFEAAARHLSLSKAALELNVSPGAVSHQIRGLEAASALPGVTIFHAGTRAADGRILANGGRVLGITACGAGVAEARERAYAAVDAIDWPGGFCRRDIGARAPGGSASVAPIRSR